MKSLYTIATHWLGSFGLLDRWALSKGSPNAEPRFINLVDYGGLDPPYKPPPKRDAAESALESWACTARFSNNQATLQRG